MSEFAEPMLIALAAIVQPRGCWRQLADPYGKSGAGMYLPGEPGGLTAAQQLIHERRVLWERKWIGMYRRACQ